MCTLGLEGVRSDACVDFGSVILLKLAGLSCMFCVCAGTMIIATCLFWKYGVCLLLEREYGTG